jgi:hypothetical protein
MSHFISDLLTVNQQESPAKATFNLFKSSDEEDNIGEFTSFVKDDLSVVISVQGSPSKYNRLSDSD